MGAGLDACSETHSILEIMAAWLCVGTSAHGLLIAFPKEVFDIGNSVSGSLWVEALNVHI